MLTNEMYIGNMVQGKYGSVSYKTKQNKPRPKSEWYVVERTHEPIIDRELWDRVQTLISQKAKPFSVGTIGLFAGKARCTNCGYTMRSSKTQGRHYLKCSNRHVAKDACIGSFISINKLEQLVEIEEKITTGDNRRELIQQYTNMEHLTREIVEILIDYISVGKRIPGTQNVPKVYMMCSLYASVQAINNSPFLPHGALHGLQLLFYNSESDSTLGCCSLIIYCCRLIHKPFDLLTAFSHTAHYLIAF